MYGSGKLTMNRKLRIMSVMAHQDDFEFNAGGIFAMLRRHHGDNVEFKILATSTGASGHHELDADATFQRRASEAVKSAEKIGAVYECLVQLDGSHVSGQIFISRNLLGGLWNSIREFEPDYIFCPPVVSDPLAGIHIDHYHTAQAVRMVAYQLGVPRAYPTIGGEIKMRIRPPAVINVDDVYSGSGDYHFYCDISDVYSIKEEMAACHESQIYEWLPFTNGMDRRLSMDEWKADFRQRHQGVSRRYRQPGDPPKEFFRITSWGRAWGEKDVHEAFPFAIFRGDGQ